MYVATTRHGYCDTCTHIRAVHGPTGDPRHAPCECCEPTGDTMTRPFQKDLPPITHGTALRLMRERDEAILQRDTLAAGLREYVEGAWPENDLLHPALRRATHREYLLALLPETSPVPDVTFDNPVTVQGETR